VTTYFDKLFAEYDQAILQAWEALDKGVDETTRDTLVKGIHEQTTQKAYFEGYASSVIGDGGKTKPCPYTEGTPQYKRWWDGFGDATQDYADNQG
jgi:hypothetical protein